MMRKVEVVGSVEARAVRNQKRVSQPSRRVALSPRLQSQTLLMTLMMSGSRLPVDQRVTMVAVGRASDVGSCLTLALEGQDLGLGPGLGHVGVGAPDLAQGLGQVPGHPQGQDLGHTLAPGHEAAVDQGEAGLAPGQDQGQGVDHDQLLAAQPPGQDQGHLPGQPGPDQGHRDPGPGQSLDPGRQHGPGQGLDLPGLYLVHLQDQGQVLLGQGLVPGHLPGQDLGPGHLLGQDLDHGHLPGHVLGLGHLPGQEQAPQGHVQGQAHHPDLGLLPQSHQPSHTLGQR